MEREDLEYIAKILRNEDNRIDDVELIPHEVLPTVIGFTLDGEPFIMNVDPA